MRSIRAILGIAILLCSTFLSAQQGLIGTYEGKWMYNAGYKEYPNYVTLRITSAENGKLAGRFTVARYTCMGEYSIDGSYQDNKLDMRTGEAAMADCGKQSLVVVVQGNKLVGKYGNNDIEFSKQ